MGKNNYLTTVSTSVMKSIQIKSLKKYIYTHITSIYLNAYIEYIIIKIKAKPTHTAHVLNLEKIANQLLRAKQNVFKLCTEQIYWLTQSISETNRAVLRYAFECISPNIKKFKKKAYASKFALLQKILGFIY